MHVTAGMRLVVMVGGVVVELLNDRFWKSTSCSLNRT
jgi:hypothetical protein